MRRATLCVGVCALVLAGCGSGSPRSSGKVRVRVLGTAYLLPLITGGGVGWCVSPNPGVCASAGERPPRAPVIAGSFDESAPPPRATGFIVTTAAVSSVSVLGGHRLALRPVASNGTPLRGIVLELSGGPLRATGREGLPALPLARLGFTLYGAGGQRLSASGARSAPLLSGVPVVSWHDAARPPAGACELRETDRAALFRGGSVVLHATPHRTQLAPGYISCASASYLDGGWSSVASVLLDAARPGARPAPLPGATPVPGHPGYWAAAAAEGEMVARRIPGAWLVVARGSGQAQRVEELEGLRASVRPQPSGG